MVFAYPAFPLKPPPLARVAMSSDDIVSAEDTTPDHSKACHELWDKNGFYNDGPFTPWPFQAEGTPARIAMAFPDLPAARTGVARLLT